MPLSFGVFTLIVIAAPADDVATGRIVSPIPAKSAPVIEREPTRQTSEPLEHLAPPMHVVANTAAMQPYWHRTRTSVRLQLPNSARAGPERTVAVQALRGRRLVAMATQATQTEDLQATTPTTPVVTLTPEAHKVVTEAIGQEPDPASLALWLEVRGVQAGSFVYDLYFQARLRRRRGRRPPRPGGARDRHPRRQRRPAPRRPPRVVRRERGRPRPRQPELAGARRGRAQRAARDPRPGDHRARWRSGWSRCSSSRSTRPSPATAGGPTSSR